MNVNLRECGTTTYQIKHAPRSSYYLWVNGDTQYINKLAIKLGRTDLWIYSFDEYNYMIRDGTVDNRMPIVVDHACFELYGTDLSLESCVRSGNYNSNHVINDRRYRIEREHEFEQQRRMIEQRPDNYMIDL